MNRFCCVLTAACLAVLPGFAHAQAYPAKPIMFVYPYSPGGGMFNLFQALGQQMAQAWGQQVVIESKPGANAIIGTEYVVKAAPDGYTLLTSDPQLVNNAAIYTKLPYNAAKDLASIGGLVSHNYFLVVSPGFKVQGVADLVSAAKAKPQSVSFASIGIGSGFHLAMELFQSMTGVKQLVHVPYKGSPAALVDISTDRVDVMFVAIASATPYLKAGKIKAIAITGARRSPQFPDLPTVSESGVPGFEVTSWYGLNAPVGTPAPVIRRVNEEIRKIVGDPAFAAKYLQPYAYSPMVGSPEDFSSFLQAEYVKWGKIARDAGVKLD